MRRSSYLYIFLFSLFLIRCTGDNRDYPRRAEVLFVGSADASAESSKYASWLAIELFKSGINLTYTAHREDLSKENLGLYDGVVLFSLLDSLSTNQAGAVQDFVDGGSGLIVLGSDPANWPAWYVEALNGQS